MVKKLWFSVLIGLLFASCQEKVDESSRYVFKEQTAMGYLKKYSNVYGEYVDLLYKVPISQVSETTVGQLLAARGHYTIFAPTNEAIQNYLDTLFADPQTDYMTAPSWDAFTDSTKLDSIRKVVVLNSILDSGDLGEAYTTTEFPTENGGEIGTSTLNDHRLSIYYSDSSDSLFLNKDCPISITNRDIPVINGYIDQMEKVIAPRDYTARKYLTEILDKQTEGYLVMARAIQACGLMDTLGVERDEVYERLVETGVIDGWQSHDYYCPCPQHRKFGFTIFAEPDDFWHEQGIDPKDPDLLANLMQWILDNNQYSKDEKFSTGTDYKSEDNLLNEWVTYHILPMRLASNRLVIHHNELGFNINNPSTYGVPVMEYYAVYGKPRLMKLYESKQSNGVCLNRFPVQDTGRRGSYNEISCDPDKEGWLVGRDDDRAVMSEITNCCIYPIYKPLCYSDEVRNSLQKDRIRYDVMAICPEFMTNDIRKQILSHPGNLQNDDFCFIPQTQTYVYSTNLYLGDETYFRYNNFYGSSVDNFQADELLVYGRYDITMKMPPVPRTGTYELRMGYLAMSGRGTAQPYFGTDLDHLYVTGIPLDMELNGNSTICNWSSDTDDDDYNAEIDKRMRNNGFMKGPLSIAPMGSPSSSGARYDPESIRRIMVRTTMEAGKSYYLRLKSVLDSKTKGLIIDYFEIVSKEVYDNPQTPEDIW